MYEERSRRAHAGNPDNMSVPKAIDSLYKLNTSLHERWAECIEYCILCHDLKRLCIEYGEEIMVCTMDFVSFLSITTTNTCVTSLYFCLIALILDFKFVNEISRLTQVRSVNFAKQSSTHAIFSAL